MNNNDKKVEELFAAGAHLGHKSNRVHPKTNKFIYSFENGVSIIDLTKTADYLEKAKKFVAELGTNEKILLEIIDSNLITESYAFSSQTILKSIIIIIIQKKI